MNVLKNKNFVRAYKIIAILLIFTLALSSVFSVLSFKYGDGIMGIKYLYKQDNDSVDVLVLGSSHAFENVNTGVLYDSYGMAAYVLAGSVQPYWNTYYYLMEALKTQTPKLIVLDAFGSTFNDEYSDNSRIIKNTLGIRDIAIRYKALKVSSPKDKFYDYLLSYRLWHSRYTEFGASDFPQYYKRPFWYYYKGFGVNFTTKSQNKPDPDKITTETPLFPKSEEYYRKIIELCKQENIPLLIVKSPYILNEDSMKKYNMSKKIADEYGVPFINFNSSKYYNSMKLDFSKDFADINHLNYMGNVKYTKALAEEIKKRFDIPDRKGQQEYESWEMHSKDVLGRTENQYLKNENNVGAYFEKLKKERYVITIATISDTDKILGKCKESLEGLGIDTAELRDGRVYVIRGGTVDYSGENSFEKMIRLDNHVLSFEKSDSQPELSLKWDGKEQISEKKGCYVSVYDSFSKELVENIRFEWSGSATVKKPAVEKK